MSLFVKTIFFSGLLSLMCPTKVSEWVLLNTEPEEYLLVYYCNEQVSEPVKIANSAIIRDIQPANIHFKELRNKNVKQPYYALFYRNRLFRKYTSSSELRNLTTSPLREKVAGEIMAGKLCVMLYLKTDNPVKDEKGKQIIQKALSSSPYRDIITYIELSRNSNEEAHFVSFLLNVEDDLKGINEPMLFGIFGRFKALEPLLAGGITEENAGLMINFLTSDCSCLIKDNMPGTDILYTNNWENPVPALVNKILDENPSLLH